MWGERGPNDHRGWCCWRGVRALHGLAWPYSLMDEVVVAVTVTVGVWFVFRWASVGRDPLRSWNVCPTGGGATGGDAAHPQARRYVRRCAANHALDDAFGVALDRAAGRLTTGDEGGGLPPCDTPKGIRNMDSGGQDGIQQLLAAENEAQQIIKAAREVRVCSRRWARRSGVGCSLVFFSS